MNAKRFLVVPFLLFSFLFSSFTVSFPRVSNDDEFIVVLDAGHGGHDPGNLGNGYLEKNIALNIVLNVGGILERNSNIKVIYTRNDDTFVDLFVRGEIANKANADLFVSVHCDSHTSDASGAGTFVLGLHANKQNFEIAKKENQVIYLEDNYESRYADYDINSPESVIGLTIMQEEFLDQSIALAKAIQDNFSNKLKRKNREVKQAGFIVLHQTFMPSVLVETGFLTNDKEGAYLNSRKGQSEMGTAIAEAILSYKNGVEANTVQLAEQTSMSVPNPDVGIESASETLDLKDAEEKFTKNPSESPIAVKPVVQNTAEEVEAVLREEPKPEIEIPSLKKEEVVVLEKPTKEELMEETTSSPIKEELEKQEEIIISEKPQVIANKASEVASKNISNVIFKVQLMASAKIVPLVPSEFNGLNNLSKEPVRNLFRYMFGNTGSYKEALLLKEVADDKGYTTSYIVAYKDGVRIPTPEAIKLVSE